MKKFFINYFFELKNMDSSRLWIQHGVVVNADDDQITDCNVVIEQGKIVSVGRGVRPPAGRGGEYAVVDAGGKYVFPGGIDPHTHCELPFMGTVAVDDYYDGTRCGLAGGTTMLIDFVIPAKGQSLREAYGQWRARAVAKVTADYSLHVAVTWWSPQVSEEMGVLVREHGVTSFKMFMAYKGVF